MSKFKIGDKVVRVDGGGGWEVEIPVGRCYTVLNEDWTKIGTVKFK